MRQLADIPCAALFYPACLLACAVGAPVPVLAQSAATQPEATQPEATPLVMRTRVGAGAFFPTDIPAGVSKRTGFSLSLSSDALAFRNGDRLAAAFRYSEYRLGFNQRLQLSSPTVEYRHSFHVGRAEKPPAGGLYAAVGAGVVYSRNAAGADGTHFAYTAALGYEAGPAFFEVRLLRGIKQGEDGVLAGTGIRF